MSAPGKREGSKKEREIQHTRIRRKENSPEGVETDKDGKGAEREENTQSSLVGVRRTTKINETIRSE